MRFLLLLLFLLPQETTEEQAKALFASATDLKRVERELTADQRERFEKATGREAPAKVSCVEARAKVMGDAPVRVVLVVVAIETPAGPAKLGVCIAPDASSLVRVRLLDHAEPKGTETSAFFRQFFLYAYAAAERPWSDLDAARKKADDGDRKLRALFAMKKAMRALALLDESLGAKLEAGKAGADDARAIAKLFDDVEKEDLSFIGAARAKALAASLANAKSMVGEVEAALKAGRLEKAKTAAAAFRDSCNGCHGGSMAPFQQARADAGISNGLFRPDFDLLPDPKLDDKIEEAVAKGVKAAVLLVGR
jgi:hypothetical protein